MAWAVWAVEGSREVDGKHRDAGHREKGEMDSPPIGVVAKTDERIGDAGKRMGDAA